MSTEGKNTTAIAMTADQATNLHPLVAAMLAQNPSVETMREIMAMQREHEKHSAERAYNAALAALKAELPSVIGKDQAVNYGSGNGRVSYKFATLAKILSEVDPLLSKYGFSLSWRTSNGDGKVTVSATLAHAGGHRSEPVTLTASPDKSGSKNDVQAIGSTVSYLERYTACALLGITTGDMPDADDAPRVETPRQEAPAAQSPTKLFRQIEAGIAAAKSALDLKTATVNVGKLSASEKAQATALADAKASELGLKRKTNGDSGKQPSAGIG